MDGVSSETEWLTWLPLACRKRLGLLDPQLLGGQHECRCWTNRRTIRRSGQRLNFPYALDNTLRFRTRHGIGDSCDLSPQGLTKRPQRGRQTMCSPQHEVSKGASGKKMLVQPSIISISPIDLSFRSMRSTCDVTTPAQARGANSHRQ